MIFVIWGRRGQNLVAQLRRYTLAPRPPGLQRNVERLDQSRPARNANILSALISITDSGSRQASVAERPIVLPPAWQECVSWPRAKSRPQNSWKPSGARIAQKGPTSSDAHGTLSTAMARKYRSFNASMATTLRSPASNNSLASLVLGWHA
jgi:hypothetical protein